MRGQSVNPNPTLYGRLRAGLLTIDRRPRYDYTISRSRGFVYYRTAKVATRSVTYWLNAHPEMDHTYFAHRRPPTDRHRDLYSFGIVRDPWDRAESCYFSKVVQTKMFRDMRGYSFEQFLLEIGTWDLDRCDRHVRRQTRALPVDRLDFIARFESLDADVAVLAGRLGLDLDLFPHLNASPRGVETVRTERTVELVADLYRSDIEAFGYAYPI